MQESVFWFVLVVGLTFCALGAGLKIGRRGGVGPRLWLGIAVLLLWLWTWLVRQPAVGVRVIPVEVLSQLEGVGAAPMFALVVGLAWASCTTLRERKLLMIAGVVGALYFVQGGVWMIQPTPAYAMSSDKGQPVVAQSQDYSCVAAATATALNQFGVSTSEREMAALTATRPGGGATLLRAMSGMRRRLATTGYDVKLVTPDYQEIQALPMPLVAPLALEPGRLHMITLLEAWPDRVRVADPVDGEISMPRDSFERCYQGQALMFVHQNRD